MMMIGMMIGFNYSDGLFNAMTQRLAEQSPRDGSCVGVRMQVCNNDGQTKS